MTSRIEAVDLARAVALLGMMLTHLGPAWLAGPPPVSDLLAGGRAAPLFALIAGVSLTLVHRRDPSGTGSVRATVARALFLLVFGVLLASLPDLRILVILPFYAVLLLAVLPFRRLSTRTLFAIGASWAVVAPIASYVLRRGRVAPETGQVDLGDLAHPAALVSELLVWGAYPAGVWFAYVLIGLAVGRLDLTRLDVGGTLVAVGAAIVLTTYAVGSALLAGGAVDPVFRGDRGWSVLFFPGGGNLPPISWRTLLAMGQHTSTPLNVLSAVGSALLVVGLCSLAMRAPTLVSLTAPLRAAGAMTFTLYTAHVVLTWAADVHGWVLVGGDYPEWWAQTLLLCAFALAWRRWRGRGPIESVVHVLSLSTTRPRA